MPGLSHFTSEEQEETCVFGRERIMLHKGYATLHTALTSEKSRKCCPGLSTLLCRRYTTFPVSQLLCDKVHWERTLLACIRRKLDLSNGLWCSSFSIAIHTTLLPVRMTKVKCSNSLQWGNIYPSAVSEGWPADSKLSLNSFIPWGGKGLLSSFTYF